MTTLEELISRIIKGPKNDYKLSYNDCLRIHGFINDSNSMFGDECCLWKNKTKTKTTKSKVGHLYINRKKASATRVLFVNYVDSLTANEYVLRTCDNKVDCVNINHLMKKTYKKPKELPIKENKKSSFKENIKVSFDE